MHHWGGPDGARARTRGAPPCAWRGGPAAERVRRGGPPPAPGSRLAGGRPRVGDRERFELLMMLADACRWAGDWQGVSDAVDEAVLTAERLDDVGLAAAPRSRRWRARCGRCARSATCTPRSSRRSSGRSATAAEAVRRPVPGAARARDGALLQRRRAAHRRPGGRGPRRRRGVRRPPAARGRPPGAFSARSRPDTMVEGSGTPARRSKRPYAWTTPDPSDRGDARGERRLRGRRRRHRPAGPPAAGRADPRPRPGHGRGAAARRGGAVAGDGGPRRRGGRALGTARRAPHELRMPNIVDALMATTVVRCMLPGSTPSSPGSSAPSSRRGTSRPAGRHGHRAPRR